MIGVKRRDYKTEILKILKDRGGCITGFNQLCKKGNFHRGSLDLNLDALKNRKLITVENIGRYNKYCIMKEDPESGFKEIFKNIIETEKKIEHTELKSQQRVKLVTRLAKQILKGCNKIDLLLLGYDHYNIYGKQSTFLENSKNWMLKKLDYNVRNLSPSDKAKIIKSIQPDDSLPLLLEKYQEIFKKMKITSL